MKKLLGIFLIALPFVVIFYALFTEVKISKEVVDSFVDVGILILVFWVFWVS